MIKLYNSFKIKTNHYKIRLNCYNKINKNYKNNWINNNNKIQISNVKIIYKKNKLIT